MALQMKYKSLFENLAEKESHLYTHLDESNLSDGVLLELDKFRHLPLEQRKKQPLLYHLLQSGTPPFKITQKDAKYQNKPKDSMACMNCEFLYLKTANKKYICSQISGEVSPEGFCNYWTKGDSN